jgi:probable phosphoglycerate mutase
MVTIYLLRHGIIEGADERRLIGQTDFPLLEKGRDQARACEQALRQVDFSEIWCSDLKRTVETAAIVSHNRSVPAARAPALREIALGQWDGLRINIIHEQYPEMWAERGRDIAGFRPPGGESFHDVQHRVLSFIDPLVSRASGNVLLVSHAGVIRSMLCHALGMPLSHLFRLHLDYCGWSIVEADGDGWRVIAVNRVSPSRW